jgi:hypothetical protein
VDRNDAGQQQQHQRQQHRADDQDVVHARCV